MLDFNCSMGMTPLRLEKQKQRYVDIIRKFKQEFLGERAIEIFSTSGRTEVGGNHTDHNAGRVLAAAVDLDIVAAVAPNEDNHHPHPLGKISRR